MSLVSYAAAESSTNDDHAFQKIINDSSRTHSNVLAMRNSSISCVCCCCSFYCSSFCRVLSSMCMDRVVYGLAVSAAQYNLHRAAYIKHYFYGNEAAAA